jgi:hypothetical protein
MNPLSSRAGALASALACLTLLLAGCGFDDTLTRRGFVKAGDQICVETLARAGAELSTLNTVSGSTFLATIGSAYGQASARFRLLEIRDEDDSMRDRIVREYSSFSRRFSTASRSPAADQGGSPEVVALFSDTNALERDLRAYGFDACGRLRAASQSG